MSDLFYSSFEELHRGSRSLIKSRLTAYLPFIEPLIADGASAKAIDLGCGRGEWLELLGESGFDARGVDLDEGMLAGCRAHGLQARQADALQSLRDLPSNSMAVISAFHVVEHIPFDDVRAVAREALRVLKPGGLLILETPNPENLVVGTSLFYQDPSHFRPIPPELLRFVVEFEGFYRHIVTRLQEAPELRDGKNVGLINVLAGVSPDYGVVAQKRGAPELLCQFDRPFGASYGITLDVIAQHYEIRVENHFSEVENSVVASNARADQQATNVASWIAYAENRLTQGDERFANLENRGTSLEKLIEQITSRQTQTEGRLAVTEDRLTATEGRLAVTEGQLAVTEGRLAVTEGRLAVTEGRLAVTEDRLAVTEGRLAVTEGRLTVTDGRLAQAEDRAIQLGEQLLAMRSSHSWRITAPLRWFGAQARLLHRDGFASRAKAMAKKAARPVVRTGIVFINSHPRLRQQYVNLLTYLGLYIPPKPLNLQLPEQQQAPEKAPSTETEPVVTQVKMDELTPSARKIYRYIKTAIERNKESG